MHLCIPEPLPSTVTKPSRWLRTTGCWRVVGDHHPAHGVKLRIIRCFLGGCCIALPTPTSGHTKEDGLPKHVHIWNIQQITSDANCVSRRKFPNPYILDDTPVLWSGFRHYSRSSEEMELVLERSDLRRNEFIRLRELHFKVGEVEVLGDIIG